MVTVTDTPDGLEQRFFKGYPKSSARVPDALVFSPGLSYPWSGLSPPPQGDQKKGRAGDGQGTLTRIFKMVNECGSIPQFQFGFGSN